MENEEWRVESEVVVSVGQTVLGGEETSRSIIRGLNRSRSSKAATGMAF